MDPWKDPNREPGRIVFPVSGLLRLVVKLIKLLKRK